ncbi:hypothetical protein [Bradyrhizobium sp. CCGE-LA001]|uniref:hypothetical protein n=1 Tax=Bradyrhizobium sp. CCGE-LA001 TaxID=1223566 RepID=UPI001314E58C|nr:hypothetical protein [Bradyrhizobium sp. CCGE-LA001]
MADATGAAFSFENAAPSAWKTFFTKTDTNGFRTAVDRADAPPARTGACAALVLSQPRSRLAWPLSLRRLHGIVMAGTALTFVRPFS